MKRLVVKTNILEILSEFSSKTESFLIDHLRSDSKRGSISIAAFKIDLIHSKFLIIDEFINIKNISYYFKRVYSKLVTQRNVPNENNTLDYTKLKNYNEINIHFLQNIMLFTDLNLCKFSRRINIFCHGSDVNILLKNETVLQKKVMYALKAKICFTFNSLYLKRQFCKIMKISEVAHNLVVKHPIKRSYFQRLAKLQNYFSPSSQAINILTVCNLTPIKNVLDGIKAVQILLKEGLDIHYLIIGVGVESESLSNYIADNGLSNNVLIINRKIANSFLGSVFLGKKIYLHTSGRNKDAEEAYGLIQREALDTGLYVVCYLLGGQHENVTSKRIIFSDYGKREKGLAASIKKIVGKINAN